jgi:hypothetical protein
MDTNGSRALRALVVTAAAGMVILFGGLVWDARLHAADPGLATSEGLFSLENPGHLLAGAGVVLLAIGLGGAVWVLWLARGRGVMPIAGALGVAVVVLAAGGATVWAGAEASHPEDAHGQRDYEALWDDASAKERAAATKLVDDTRAATLKYADYEEASRAGYRPNARAGPRATHHPNPSLMRDGKVLDPSAPESLMYWTAPDGRKVLVGAVYKAGPTEEAPAPGGELTAWHTHAGGTMCHPALEEDCPDDTMRMLHVFFFDGVQDPFAETMARAAGGRDAFARAMKQ